ncbi:MAG: hypothetical protein ABJM06_14820 [Gilvibacter sp.]
MKSLILAIFILFSFQISNSLQEGLVGTWECYHKEKEDGTTKSTDLFTGEEFEYSCNGLSLEFNSDFSGVESLNGLAFNYSLKDSILTIGNRTYILELLDDTEMVMRNYDPKGISLSGFRTKFKRVRK